MGTTKFAGTLLNIESAELIGILKELVPNPSYLKDRMGPVDEEIDYEDDEIEIHFYPGPAVKEKFQSKFLMNGELNLHFEDGLGYFSRWADVFHKKGIHYSFELFDENDKGEEIRNHQLRHPDFGSH